MERLRLDPSDPLASVLAWLAALARALGFDLAALRGATPTREDARSVRLVLLDWRRGLRALIQVQALLLARRLAPPPLPGGEGAGGVGRGEASGACRAAALQSWPAGDSRTSAMREARRAAALRSRPHLPRTPSPPGRGGVPPAAPDPDAPLAPAEEGALRRRTRAVLLALMDPSAAILRLARRLARRRPPRPASPFGPPPRDLGVAVRAPALKPEPRPPDLRVLSSA